MVRCVEYGIYYRSYPTRDSKQASKPLIHPEARGIRYLIRASERVSQAQDHPTQVTEKGMFRHRALCLGLLCTVGYAGGKR